MTLQEWWSLSPSLVDNKTDFLSFTGWDVTLQDWIPLSLTDWEVTLQVQEWFPLSLIEWFPFTLAGNWHYNYKSDFLFHSYWLRRHYKTDFLFHSYWLRSDTLRALKYNSSNPYLAVHSTWRSQCVCRQDKHLPETCLWTCSMDTRRWIPLCCFLECFSEKTKRSTN